MHDEGTKAGYPSSVGTSSPKRNKENSIWTGRYLPITLANLTVVAVAAFDGLAIVAALPNIAKDLGNVSLSPWVLTAYLATSALAAIVAGPIIDTIGVRKTFQITGLWFLFTSALAAIAPSMTLLIAARSLQGIGGGLVIAVALASVGLAYPEKLRPTAFAANSMVWGTLGLGGPVLAGALLELSGWRLIFVVQLPITALALAMGWKRLPDAVDNNDKKKLNFDLTGITLLSICIIASLIAVSELTKSPIPSAILFMATGFFIYIYWRHSGQKNDPVLLQRHITKFPLSRIHAASALALITGLATDNYLPLYMQTTRGRSEAFASFSVVFPNSWLDRCSICHQQDSKTKKRRRCDPIRFNPDDSLCAFGRYISIIFIRFSSAVWSLFLDRCFHWIYLHIWSHTSPIIKHTRRNGPNQ